MIDRKTIELAAEACGYRVHGWLHGNLYVNFGEGARGIFGPHEDSGQCADMEADLGVNIVWNEDGVCANCRIRHVDYFHMEQFANHSNDRRAARRAASVRLAAKIGAAASIPPKEPTE